MQWQLLLYIVVVFGVSLFAINNQSPVRFDFLFGQAQVKLAILLILSTGIGALLGVVTTMIGGMESRRLARRTEEDLEDAAGRIYELESLVDEYERALGKPTSYVEPPHDGPGGQTTLPV